MNFKDALEAAQKGEKITCREFQTERYWHMVDSKDMLLCDQNNIPVQFDKTNSLSAYLVREWYIYKKSYNFFQAMYLMAHGKIMICSYSDLVCKYKLTDKGLFWCDYYGNWQSPTITDINKLNTQWDEVK